MQKEQKKMQTTNETEKNFGKIESFCKKALGFLDSDSTQIGLCKSCGKIQSDDLKQR